eukprot:CAMPEP_0119063396 /NCGR_PEP_ID=MMETSP1178-20130426/6749_1 /TAXON_ID=33656 /ORGANISM="unid sp, Strain CCMP2000" /LENGTH=153 /DNA_ID=CAMNT_0007044763 /DNA_START=97 /DNA_END=554 /DNA_ORIENTATION=+
MPPKGKRKKTPLGGQRTAGLKEFRKWQEQKLFELQCAHDQEKQDLEQRQKQELAAFQEKAKQQRQEKISSVACFYCQAAVDDVSKDGYAWQRKDKSTCVHCKHSRKCPDCAWTVVCAYHDWHGFCGFCVEAANICTYCDGGCSVCQADAGCCR